MLATMRIHDEPIGAERLKRFALDDDRTIRAAGCDRMRQPIAHSAFVSQHEPSLWRRRPRVPIGSRARRLSLPLELVEPLAPPFVRCDRRLRTDLRIEPEALALEGIGG